ncbi:MAG TPA: sigma-70 family RNA polymerase sigma factor [Gemmataceae bacterium]|jgi:RNA polymerase sigma factor (sigma-70 family)|nr:sigma-70 family RNA polymerase sigma factor [Gemmataceae bacterium]
MHLVDGRRVLGYLRGLTAPAGSDAELLRRFVARNEEAAFAELVARHGPMVRGVCLRLLGNQADADDVFQATFLVLARRAPAIRQPGAVGAWLHGVACRLARKVRNCRRCETALDPQIALTDPSDPFAEACWREVRQLLDLELEQLSDSLRLPLVLCYLEELTRDEAAARLGWSVRTLDRRLQRGRELLQERLRRRGVEAAALATVGLGGAGLSAAVPAVLAEATTRSAVAFALGQTVSGPAAMLAEGAMHMFAMLRWKWAAGMVLALGMLAVAGTLLLPGADPVQPPGPGTKPGNQAPLADANLAAGAVTRLGSLAFHHGAEINRLCFSPDGRRVLSLSLKDLLVWEAGTGRELLRLSAGKGETGDFIAAAFTPDGKAIAAVYADGMARVWDAENGKELRSRRLHDDALDSTQIFIAPSGGQRVLVLAKQKLLSWDPVSDKLETVPAVVRLPGDDGTGGGAPGPRGIQSTDVFADSMDIVTGGRLLVALTSGNRLATIELAEKPNVLRWDPIENIRGLKALSPDGKWLVLVGVTVDNPGGAGPGVVFLQHDALYLWDVAHGKLVRSLNWPLQSFVQLRCAFAPDGGSVFVANGPAVVRWEIATGKILRQWTNFPDTVTSLAVSPDGHTLAAASAGSVRVFDVASGAEKQDSHHSAAVNVLAFSPDGKTLYTGSADRTLRQWDAATGKHLRIFDEHLAGVTALAVSPDGKWIASAGSNNRPNVIRLWDAASGQFVRQLRGHQRVVQSLTFSSKSQALASAAVDGVRVWWLESGDELAKSGSSVREAMAVAFSQQDTVAIGTQREVGDWAWSGKVPPKLWDLEEAAIMRHSAGINNNWVAGIAFSPQNGRVALAVNQNSIDNQVTESTVVCCETATGRVICRLHYSGSINCVAITADGRKIATGDSDGGIRIWEIDSGAEKANYAGHRGPVRALVFSPDGQHLASGGADTTSLIWTVP